MKTTVIDPKKTFFWINLFRYQASAGRRRPRHPRPRTFRKFPKFSKAISFFISWTICPRTCGCPYHIVKSQIIRPKIIILSGSMPFTVLDSSWKRFFFVNFMITAWLIRPNSYPSRTKIKVTLSRIINNYLSSDPFYFDTCDISVTSRFSNWFFVNFKQVSIFFCNLIDNDVDFSGTNRIANNRTTTNYSSSRLPLLASIYIWWFQRWT